MKKSLVGVLVATGVTAALAVTLTLQGSLNALVMAPTSTTYTTQGALNILAMGHADSLTGMTSQAAANYLVNHGAQLAIPPARTNTAPVRVNGSWSTMSTSANLGASAGVTTREFFAWNHGTRIRQACTITQAKIYIGSTTAWDTIGVRFWQQAADTDKRFNHKGWLFKLPRASASVGINTITGLSFDVPVGYYYSVAIIKQSADAPSGVLQGVAETNGYLIGTTTAPTLSRYPWINEGAVAGGAYRLEVEFYTDTPPQVVWLGYSHLAGRGVWYSFQEPTTIAFDTLYNANGVTQSVSGQFALLRPGITYQNTSIGGETAAQIIARASASCFALKPRVAIIQMGANDTDSSLVYTHMSTALDSCQARGIIPVVVGMSPLTNKPSAWSGSALSHMRWRDRVNKSLQVLCQTHAAGAIYVETDGLLGKNRATGPIGNRWDIATAGTTYDSGDGLHYSAAGQTALATAINNALKFDFTRP